MSKLKHKLAAQLYTLREEVKRDFPHVLQELKGMGWPAVQISGFHGYDPVEISNVMQKLQLNTAGMHVPLERLINEADQVVWEASLFNTKDIVCPFITETYRSIEGYLLLKEELNEISRKFRVHGLRLSYHNHDFELNTSINGRSALEFLLDPSDGNELLAEIDVYWLSKAGVDPFSFIQTYKNRMPIIHLKDMTKDERQTFAEIGTGVIDFIPILQWCEKSGVEWYAVEQDQCAGNPMDSLKISWDNLDRLISEL
jgi:sugar phosphate isomerase/epimerase